MNVKEIREFGVMLTIFENGDVYVSTPGDVHLLKVKEVYAGLDTTIVKVWEKTGKALEEAHEIIVKATETIQQAIKDLKK